ncbi:MAG: hypothetical protein HYS51_00715 [Candidatus Zambryskibacteria bacterium]|nr:hypothetical protein [Candidatus Zambryskibacteria bacterium]
MRIILLKDVKGVGKIYEEKNVSDGYAANFLLPKNFALVADKAGVAKAKQLKERSDAKRIAEEERLKEKETKRQEKHLELEKFKQAKHLPLSSE